jgi:tetratricopeptide (TPR) repeat protein
MSAAQLLEQAEKEMDIFAFDKAEALLRRVLEVDQNNTRAMDLLAEILIEEGNIDPAKDLLQKSIQLAPEVDFSKYMNLGQILSGDEAISCYKRGVEVMLVHKRNHPAPPVNPFTPSSPALIDQQLSQALCSLAELYLTDACYDPNAERECEKFINAALEHNPQSAEAYYLMASMRISQEKPQDALPLVQKSYNLWKAKALEKHKGKENEEYHPERDDLEEKPEDEDAWIIPGFETRHNTAKLFIELGQFQDALSILELLVLENDSDPSVWYTYAQAYVHTASLPDAFESLCAAKKLISRDGAEPELVEKVEKLMAEVKGKLNAQGIEVDEQDDEDMGD